MKYFVIILLSIFGCKTSNSPGRKYLRDACEELEAKMDSVWKYDLIQELYVGNDSFLNEMTLNVNKYRDCLESKDTSYIVKLFGKHFSAESNPEQDKYPHKLIYMTTKHPCLGRGSDYHCACLVFYFDERSWIKKVVYFDISSGISY